MGNGFHRGEESASLYLEVWYFLRAIHFTSSSHMAPVILFPEIIILLGGISYKNYHQIDLTFEEVRVSYRENTRDVEPGT